jgi:DNA processing protein
VTGWEEITACDRCLRRAWLLARLAGHLDPERGRLPDILALGDDGLIAAVGGAHRERIEQDASRFDPDRARSACAAAELSAICRCEARYPPALRDLTAPPAVLHVRGEVAALGQPLPVAVVGTRRPSAYGVELASAIARGVASCGLPVASGMALGIDSAAHRGALEAAGPTIAVLAAGAERPYPAARRALYRRIVAGGAVVSELPPGTGARRWMFPARNRIIAALAAATVVVEAGERSGSLITAAIARELGRPVGALPGRVTSPLAAGPHGLLAAGASVVRGAADVIGLLGAAAPAAVQQRARSPHPPPDPELRSLFDAIRSGADTASALSGAGFTPREALAGIAALELAGHVRRGPGGRLCVIA